MNIPRLAAGSLAALSFAALALAGCERKANDRGAAPAPTLPSQAQTAPSSSDHAAAMARLDQQIRDAQTRVDQSSGQEKADRQDRLDALKARRDQLQQDYNQARYDQLEADMADFFDRVGRSIQHGADATGDAAKSAGDKIKDTVNGQ